MIGRDLKAMRIKLTGDGYGDVKKMAEKLELAKRTYQDYESRKGNVPGPVSVAVKLMLKLHEIQAQDQYQTTRQWGEILQPGPVPNQT